MLLHKDKINNIPYKIKDKISVIVKLYLKIK